MLKNRTPAYILTTVRPCYFDYLYFCPCVCQTGLAGALLPAPAYIPGLEIYYLYSVFYHRWLQHCARPSLDICMSSHPESMGYFRYYRFLYQSSGRLSCNCVHKHSQWYCFVYHTDPGCMEVEDATWSKISSYWHVHSWVSVSGPLPYLGYFPSYFLNRTIITSIVRLATLWPLVTSKDPTYEVGLAGIFMWVTQIASSLLCL